MSTYRTQLPQLGDRLFMTDGGLETTLIFDDGIDLPYFAAFDLLKNAQGTERLRRYYERYARIAADHGLGMVLEAPTWRASRDWGAKLGYDAERAGCRESQGDRPDARTARDVRGARPADGDQRQHRPARRRLRAGPADERSRQARDYHAEQIATFVDTAADMVAVFTMNYVEEAAGIAQAARAARHAGRRLVHARDRRPPAERRVARRRDRAHRRGIAGPSRVLHDQLRAPDALRACAGTTRRGRLASAACAPTRRAAAMPSSTRAPTSMRATPRNSAASTARCGRGCRG